MSESLPFAPGAYVYVGNHPDLFKVLSFDGTTYPLRSQFGAECRAGRKAVRRAPRNSKPISTAISPRRRRPSAPIFPLTAAIPSSGEWSAHFVVEARGFYQTDASMDPVFVLDTLSRMNPLLPILIFLAVGGLLFWALLRLWRGARRRPYRRVTPLLSASERALHRALQNTLGDDSIVLAKVHAAALLLPGHGLARGERRRAAKRIGPRTVDFVICDALSGDPQVAISVAGNARRRAPRKARDRVFEKACRSAGLALLRLPAAAEYSPTDLRQRLQPHITPPQDRVGLISPQTAMVVPKDGLRSPQRAPTKQAPSLETGPPGQEPATAHREPESVDPGEAFKLPSFRIGERN